MTDIKMSDMAMLPIKTEYSTYDSHYYFKDANGEPVRYLIPTTDSDKANKLVSLFNSHDSLVKENKDLREALEFIKNGCLRNNEHSISKELTIGRAQRKATTALTDQESEEKENE